MAAGRQDGRRFHPDAQAFAGIVGESVDYAVMENTDHAAMVPASMYWSDIGNWQALPTAVGAYLFGFTDALRTRQDSTIDALLVVGGLLLLGLALARLRERRRRTAAAYAGLAAACIGWFTVVGVVPAELVAYAPQVTTLVVLALASQDLRPPAAIGLPYRRGEQA